MKREVEIHEGSRLPAILINIEARPHFADPFVRFAKY
jgi:hypothetical protein